MIGPGMLGGQQQKDEIDVLVVERAEFDGLGEPGKKAHDVGEARQPAVRDGNTAPNGCRAQAFALQQRLEDLTRVDASQLGCLLGQLLQRLLFVVRFQGGEDSFARYGSPSSICSLATRNHAARSCLLCAVASGSFLFPTAPVPRSGRVKACGPGGPQTNGLANRFRRTPPRLIVRGSPSRLQ